MSNLVGPTFKARAPAAQLFASIQPIILLDYFEKQEKTRGTVSVHEKEEGKKQTERLQSPLCLLVVHNTSISFPLAMDSYVHAGNFSHDLSHEAMVFRNGNAIPIDSAIMNRTRHGETRLHTTDWEIRADTKLH